MKITESKLNKMIADAINEYHIKNANGNYTRYNFSDYARKNPTFGNIHNNPNDFYGRKYTSKPNQEDPSKGWLNPENFRSIRGQETWVSKMIQRENMNRKSIGQELGALEKKIRGYLNRGYFGTNEDIKVLVNVYCSFLAYTSRKYQYFIKQYLNRQNVASKWATPQETPAENSEANLEEAQSIYGLNTNNGTQWITDLENEIRALLNDGVFRGEKTKEINNDFLELLRLGRLGKPTAVKPTQQPQDLQQSTDAQAANTVPSQPTQPGKQEKPNSGDKMADNVMAGFEETQVEVSQNENPPITPYADPNIEQKVSTIVQNVAKGQGEGGRNGKNRLWPLAALVGLALTISAFLGLKGCSSDNQVITQTSDDSNVEVVDQTPQTQGIVINFDNQSAEITQESLQTIQNLDPNQEYEIVVQGNKNMWYIKGQPCDPETSKQYQEMLDKQRVENAMQVAQQNGIKVTSSRIIPAGQNTEQATGTFNVKNNGTINFDDAQKLAQQAQGENQGQQEIQKLQENKRDMVKIRINESDIAKMVECCIKKINEMDDYFSDDNVSPYDAIKQAIENGAPESVVMELIKQYARTSAPELMAQPEETMTEPAGLEENGVFNNIRTYYQNGGTSMDPVVADYGGMEQNYWNNQNNKKLEEAVDRVVNQVLKEMLG